MGLMAFVPMLPVYLRERFGMDDPEEVRRWTGAVYGVAPLVAALCGPLWGVLGDRHGRKPMALRAVLGIALVTALMPLANGPGQLTALRGMQGLLAGYVAPAMALVAADVPAERQSRTLGGLQVGMALGMLLGPLVGSEVAAAFGRPAVFYVTSGLAVCGAVPIVVFAREGTRPEPADRPGLVDVARFVAHPIVAVLMLAFFLMRGAQMMVDAYLALWVTELGPLSWLAGDDIGLVHALDRTTAMMFTVLAAAQILFAPLWGRAGDRFGPLRCLAFLSAVLGVLVALSGLAGNAAQFLVFRCASATFACGTMTLSYAAISKRVPTGRKAVAFACVQSFMQLGMFAGPLVGGQVSSVFGLQSLFFVAGGLSVAASGVMLAIRRHEV